MATRRKRKNDSWFSFLDAHRLKATLASIAATIGLLVSMGVVDVGKLPPWAIQLLPQLGLAPTTGIPTAAAPPVSNGDGALSTCFTPGQDCTSTIISSLSQRRQLSRLTRPGSRASAAACAFFMRASNHTVVSASVTVRTPSVLPLGASLSTRWPRKSKPGVLTNAFCSGWPLAKSKRLSTS